MHRKNKKEKFYPETMRKMSATPKGSNNGGVAPKKEKTVLASEYFDVDKYENWLA